MLKKRLTKIAALCIASTLLLAGCSGGSTKSSPNPDSEKDSAAAAPIVLKFSDVNAEALLTDHEFQHLKFISAAF